MTLDRKLGITDAVELARVKERLSKARAHKLFSSDFLSALPVGCFEALAGIHQYLFEEIYVLQEKSARIISQKAIFALLRLCI